MSEFLKVKVEVDTTGLENRFSSLCNDDWIKLNMHRILAKRCDPYVPYLNNPLSRTVQVTPDYIEYVQPYAHYQYHGIDFNHTLTHHPLASAEWDQAMLRDHREEFEQELRALFVRRYKELYG